MKLPSLFVLIGPKDEAVVAWVPNLDGTLRPMRSDEWMHGRMSSCCIMHEACDTSPTTPEEQETAAVERFRASMEHLCEQSVKRVLHAITTEYKQDIDWL